MARLACLHYEPSGALSALPLIDPADCPGLVVLQSVPPSVLSPSLALLLVLLGALAALAVIRHHCEGLRRA
jgi:hypothetical protein